MPKLLQILMVLVSEHILTFEPVNKEEKLMSNDISAIGTLLIIMNPV